MATPDTFELNRLLNPITQDNSCGEDICDRKDNNGEKNDRIKYTSTDIYYLYQQAIDCEKQIPDKEKGQDEKYFFRESIPKWQDVYKKANQILTEESKDLYVVQIFIQSLVRLKGFGGLRDGFRLIHDLIEKFLDKIYPLPDVAHEDNRVWPLANLNGSDANKSALVKGIRLVSLVNPPGQTNLSSITCLDFISRGEAFKASLTNYPAPEFFKTLREDIEACQFHFEKLCQLINERCGTGKFPSSHIRQALIDCRSAVRILSNENEMTENEENSNSESDAPLATGVSDHNIKQNKLTSRESALQTILQVADYLEKTEPHSPVPSLLRKAVRWSRMSYADLLKEMIADDSACKRVYTLTGIDSNPK